LGGNVECQREFPHDAKHRLSLQQRYWFARSWLAQSPKRGTGGRPCGNHAAIRGMPTRQAAIASTGIASTSIASTGTGDQRAVTARHTLAPPLTARMTECASTARVQYYARLCAVTAATVPLPANQRALPRIHRRAAPVKN